jgi:hypothetical protein
MLGGEYRHAIDKKAESVFPLNSEMIWEMFL